MYVQYQVCFILQAAPPNSSGDDTSSILTATVLNTASNSACCGLTEIWRVRKRRVRKRRVLLATTRNKVTMTMKDLLILLATMMTVKSPQLPFLMVVHSEHSVVLCTCRHRKSSNSTCMYTNTYRSNHHAAQQTEIMCTI
jgi:hypothetical protein